MTENRPEGHVDSTERDARRNSERRPGELTVREMLRWLWRQLTSMRTALVLLLLLALAAVPGSIVPQSGVDALKTSRWQASHDKLTPIYEKLGLFSVYNSAWFSAIYLLLMISLVGCIVPRTFVYWRAMRAAPPPAPRNLSRLPDHTSYTSQESVEEVLDRARTLMLKRRFRLRVSTEATDESHSTGSTGSPDALDSVSSERGYLREAGNLLFHLSVLIVLVGFALGALFGYKGGVILVVDNGFANNLTQYDDFVPGTLFRAEDMEPFSFTVDNFDVEWLTSGPRKGMARAFNAHMRYRETPSSPEKTYDLRVNHPLTIGDTEVFLIGHGYAPVITIRDGNGDIAYSGPTIFLPQDQSFLSFGVVKSPDARPGQIGLEGLFYPYFVRVGDDPINLMGDDKNPLVSLSVYTGDLNMDNGTPQSVYVLDKADTTQVMKDGKPLRIDLSVGETETLPNGLGSVSFEGVEKWNKIQISQTPGKRIALAGVILALIGLLGSLFIRPRRIWVRARREGDGTLVEVAGLDRSGGGDVSREIADIVAALRGSSPAPRPAPRSVAPEPPETVEPEEKS